MAEKGKKAVQTTAEIPVKAGFESWDSPAIQQFMEARKDSAFPYEPALKEGEAIIYGKYKVFEAPYKGDTVSIMTVQVGADGETSLASLYGKPRRFIVRKSDGSRGQAVTIDNLLPYNPETSKQYKRNNALAEIIGESLRVRIKRLEGWYEGSENKGFVHVWTFAKVD